MARKVFLLDSRGLTGTVRTSPPNPYIGDRMTDNRKGMTIADKIAEYTAAAARSGLPVKSIVIEKGKVAVNFGAPVSGDEGLGKDWSPRK